MLDRMLAVGVDGVRINCSHGTADELRARAGAARAAAVRSGRPVGLLFDLQGPKLRLAADTATRTLRPGNAVVFRGSGRAGANELIVDYADFPSLVTDRSDIVIGDGVPRCAVEEVEGDRVLARAMTSGRCPPARA